MSLELLLHYKLEIIAALVILALIILYLLLTKRPKKKEVLLEIEPAVVDEYEDQTQPEDVSEAESPMQQDLLSDDTLQQLQTETKPQHTLQELAPQFKKQIVPPHGKITKEDFQRFKGRRILLAEDNIINQKVILGLLSGSGIDVVIANDGQEALNILETDDDFMLILMDAHMPNIDGFEATKIIRKNPKYDHIVVVALSGDTASDDIKKMKEAGMSETLEKPLKIDAFYDILYAYDTALPSSQTQLQKRQTGIELLNIEEGLTICGGDKEFYKDLLKEFLQDYSKSDEALAIFIKEEKYEEADRLLLDIVGVAANLGAKKLHNIAVIAKDILKTQNRDLSSTLTHYKETLHQTLHAIQTYIQEN